MHAGARVQTRDGHRGTVTAVITPAAASVLWDTGHVTVAFTSELEVL